MLGTSPARVSAPADLRRLNLSRVLNHLRDNGTSARSEIATATGLVRGSITGLVGVLLAEGLVREVDESLNRGRSAPKLAIDGHDRAVLVVELTVDRFNVFCCDLAERPIFDEHARHGGAGSDPEHILGIGAGLARKGMDAVAAHGARLERAVFVIAAPVSDETGLVPISVDLGWTDVDLRGIFRSLLPELTCPLSLVGDARMGGWAEYQHLRRSGADDLTDMVYLKSDTGIGGIVVTRGEILVGGHGMAFVPGHMSIDPNGEPCACGQRGCLVTVAGPEVVVTRAGLGAVLAADGVTTAVDTLLERADAGEPAALAALAAAGEWLGRFMTLLLVGLDPTVIVLGGYWAAAFDHLRAGMAHTFGVLAPGAGELYSDSTVRAAALGAKANIVGAVDLAVRACFDQAETAEGI